MKKPGNALNLIMFLLLCAVSCATAYRFEYASFESAALERRMNYSVYLPPGWDSVKKLPLVVFLHGGGDDEECFDDFESFREIDQWIEKGMLDPFILAVPDGELGFWANWYDGTQRYEDYVIEDVIPHIRKNYPVLKDRESTHLMGISMGGAGALYMSVNRPEVFASASVISAPVYNTDQVLEFLQGFFWKHFANVQRIFGPPERERVEQQNIYNRVKSAADLGGVRLLVAAGTQDRPGIFESTRVFHRHMKERKIPHRYMVFKGGHLWVDWRPMLPAVLCSQINTPGRCSLPEDDYYELEEFFSGGESIHPGG